MDEIVLKACAVDPADRFLTAGEMAHALRRASWRSLPEAPALNSLLSDVTGEIRLPDLEPTSFEGRNGHKKKTRKRFRTGRLALVLAIAAALVFGAWKGVSAFLAPQNVDVPNVKGLPLEEARSVASEWDLDVVVAKRRPHLKVEEGAIIKQTPQRGTLEEGSTIEVIVSKGLPVYDVPEVIGLTETKARKAIVDSKLKVGNVTERFDDAEPGTVVAQVPLPDGKIEHGEDIRLVLSKGPRPVGVPDVVELTSAAATKALERAGFAVAVSEQYSDDVEEGIVMGSTPAAGEGALPGSEITIVVSAGPEFEKFRMPDVRGMGSGAATSKLEGMGLSVRSLVVDGCQGDTVQDTSPLPGATVQEGERVTLYVC
jgi:serine/threonine-protein kinase